MDAHGNMFVDGFCGDRVVVELNELTDGSINYWLRADGLLIAGPFATSDDAENWATDPEYRNNNPNCMYGLNIWCVTPH